MERDVLAAHGAAFALKDRLLECSDKFQTWICTKCGNISIPPCYTDGVYKGLSYCKTCESFLYTQEHTLPYAWKLFTQEQTAIGNRISHVFGSSKKPFFCLD
jgi:DNA-directed RNA polymerase II subunit RPB2